jgi:hypothetical protein
MICERLMETSGIDASDVEVDVQGGRVTLEGKIDSRMSKYQIEDMIETMGVSDVQNNLRISREGGQSSASGSDRGSSGERSSQSGSSGGASSLGMSGSGSMSDRTSTGSSGASGSSSTASQGAGSTAGGAKKSS